MPGFVHSNSADCKGSLLCGLHPFLVILVGFLDNWLVGVKIVEFCEDGVGGEEELEPVGEAGDVLLAAVEALADIVRRQLAEVLAGQAEVGQLVGLISHHYDIL